MKVCVLCEDSKVDHVRKSAKSFFYGDAEPVQVAPKSGFLAALSGLRSEKGILSIPVSESGQLPATHWFCVFSTSEDKFARIASEAKEYLDSESCMPNEFLEKRNLKIIK